MKNWQFSIGLLVGYVLVFQAWVGAERSFVVSSGILWCLTFSVWTLVQWRKGYFRNRLDGGLHGVVILDVLLESLLITDHSHSGFWLCAFGFGFVIGGYRYKLLREAHADRNSMKA